MRTGNIFSGHQVLIASDENKAARVERVTSIGQEVPSLPPSGIDAVVTLPSLIQVHCTRWLIWYSCGQEVVLETARTYYFKVTSYLNIHGWSQF